MTTGRPLLSIIVSTFNDAENLRSTLESIACQEGAIGGFEVVISDGESTDTTSTVCNTYEWLISGLRSSPDNGVYDGMNIGAMMAKGRWLHFLNAGDTFKDAMSLATLLAELAVADLGDEYWAICRAEHLGVREGEPVPIRSVPHRWLLHAYGLQPHCHQATFFRGEAFAIVGPHDLSLDFVADHALIMRFGALWRPYVIDATLIRYLGGGISQTRGKEIPLALERNRRTALGWRSLPKPLDRAATVTAAAAAKLRVWAGSMRHQL